MATSRATSKTKDTFSNLKGDYGNIVFLVLLYVLQGIPIGLSTSIPLLLQNRKVSYSDQAIFSFVTWPFSVKLLWAPIVDSIFWQKLGRRKSWLVPAQLCIGVFMLILSGHIEGLMSEDASIGRKPNVVILTAIFFMFNFLAATQDIAVDGWALTMLSRRNVGYASTCNTVGQTAGYFLGNVIFLALESAEFSNRYLRSASNQQASGVVTFQSFLYYCGIAFLVITLLVALLKNEKRAQIFRTRHDSEHEASVRLTRRKNSEISNTSSAVKSTEVNDDDDEEDLCSSSEDDLTVKGTYLLLYKIMKLPSLKVFALILLTCKIGFAAPDAVSGLKLIESGVHKENLAMLAVPMLPLQMILPWVLSRMTCGPKPLNLFIKSYPYRLLFGLIFPLVVYWTPSMKQSDDTFPVYYYTVILIIYAVHQVTVYSMYVSLMAFNAAVSDPSIGGTYMTLLNTISNLGGNWPSTLSLWLVDRLTITSCSKNCTEQAIAVNATTNASNIEVKPDLLCKQDCSTLIDGYYLECIVCVVIGFLWLLWGGDRLRRLQKLPQTAWSVSSNKAH